MADDIVMHLSSNSSNPSDPSLPTKLAKLEARMAGKSSSSPSPSLQPSPPPPPPPPPPSKFGPPEDLPESSSDSDDDDNGGNFLILHNTRKRQRVQEDDDNEGAAYGRTKLAEALDVRSVEELNKKRQPRGRGRSVTGRGRGSKASDQMRSSKSSSTASLSNGHHESSLQKESWPKEQIGNDERASLQEEISLLRGKVSSLEEELSKSRQETTDCKQLFHQLEKEFKDFKEYDQQMKAKRLKVLSDLLISVSKAERQEARMKVRQESLRLGNVGVIRAGTIISETWEDGQTLKDINSHIKSLLEMKEAIERHRKSLKKRQSDKGDGSDAESGMSEEEFLIQDEIFKSRLSSIKREEETCLRERDRYELEKARLIREMKRIRDEDGSRFNNFQILNQRYALLNLLGKGGFSEVYKAYDLLENRYVACKLHGLNAQWSEEKKQSYIRHAVREYDIHKTLVHPHIVRLWDIFEIDHNTFCTVLEYCSGKDLDAVLKATPILPEREARIVIVQIFQGLIYMNKRAQRIIHYDLKPGNVLFDEVGVAKVTDFGLSKIVEDNVGSQGMELTSQGAGTYWYLPPECFELSKIPLISSKVDVWSAGIMLYQMLFGRRPFGHNQTQERILREDTIINARRVEFPSKPSVSNEAKDLIRRCLTYNQADRPDVLTIAQDPYLSYAKR
ncbi:serine/threonine-protein kinase TOUSLED [Iris pallida]|uniref:Serine/threonine-protein kinase TOUSLED n=1 Tax=Iris pallida TaxID=29817 RepID=A0AAX6IGY6_IRIPA|nr:serine/threonine-protein kinase TOUSLED [Iris pallida]KAJ6852348.1 serine/threonine-protein kinase TOUSLED [Iris pallida]